MNQTGLTKAELRQRMRQILGDFTHASRELGLESAMVQDLVRGSASWAQAATVLAYSSLATEVPTGPLIRAALSEGKNVCLPRVLGAGSMEFRIWTGEERELRASRFGIPEPDPRLCPLWNPLASPAESLALCLVPGLAFTRQGLRLGRGGGFYDRFLEAVRTGRETDPRASRIHFLGLAFSVQMLEQLPRDPTDQSVDEVVAPANQG